MDSAKTHYTVDEYLRHEEVSEIRHEYHNGYIKLRGGSSLNHNRIAGKFCSDFNIRFENQSYEAFITEVKLWIPFYHSFTYPDVMIIQGEPKFLEGRKDTLLDPVLIVEVLSDSTELYDRTDKFKMYRTLASLKEYILISQYQTRVEQFAIDAQGEWVFRDYEGEENVLKLVSVPFEIKLSQLYRKVNFASETRSEPQ